MVKRATGIQLAAEGSDAKMSHCALRVGEIIRSVLYERGEIYDDSRGGMRNDRSGRG